MPVKRNCFFFAPLRLGVKFILGDSRKGANEAGSVRMPRGCYNSLLLSDQPPATAGGSDYMPKRTLRVERMGRVEYATALDLQKQTELAVLTGAQPDTLLLLEHPHTLTLGRRSPDGGIVASTEVLQKRGVTVFETNRGGKVTYHGLGQIVGYPIINLSPDREDVHRFVRDLEEVLLRTMNDFQIEAFRIEGLTGVHTARGKVAAIGVHIARWVTTHGFALNVNTDLSYFELIIACEGEPVTSMQELLGREVEMSAVEDRIIEHFAAVFEMCQKPDREGGLS
ncbi:MAG: lipoyl(octanoyl) transferase [Blastocatellia bacterium]|nr:lipoyl(octanoyl) transferase [Blastocatellia bacterium]